MSETGEFSFILKPSEHGVGVFAAHQIVKGTRLALFGKDEEPAHHYRVLNKDDVPEYFQQFCLDRTEGFVCPPDFRVMPVGWYLNHSQEPNAEAGPTDARRKIDWYAKRDIKEGEEILINYNEIHETNKAAFYKEDI